MVPINIYRIYSEPHIYNLGSRAVVVYSVMYCIFESESCRYRILYIGIVYTLFIYAKIKIYVPSYVR